ncbi:MAG: helix-turn-helix domain-containing protein [Lewinellaceae bacterium]|nr:helix-turn-helix domain-containing protein [Lewinellaceae bacterium]
MLPNIAVILTDAQRKILWVNDDFTEITGYTLTEVIGKKPSLLQGPGSEQDAINRIRRSLEHQIAFREEITNYRKNGEAYLCKLVIHPVFDRQQHLTNFIAFEVDGDVVKDVEDLPLLQLQEKYSSSSLKGLEEVKLFFKVKLLVEQERLYLDPDLSLKEVADRLHTNTKYLSQVVNHHAGCNFQHFINSFRVKEVKEKITDKNYHNLTLFGIALQCGFKNKSTFYKVFREITGQTPKEYIKMARA